jgi:hypothetical protein
MQSTTTFGDYRKFGSLLQPATTKVSVMNTQLVMAITTVEYGKVDPAVFSVPGQIKAIIK